MGKISDNRIHTSPRSERGRQFRIGLTSALIILLFTGGMMGTGAMNLLAKTILGIHRAPPQEQPSTSKTVRVEDKPVDGIVPASLDIHPDRLYQAYIEIPDNPDAKGMVPYDIARAFGELAEIFRNRQAVDDNFTMRVYNVETGDVLGVHSLDDDRSSYEQAAAANWRIVDGRRRSVTRDLVKQYADDNVPRENLMVKWGRKNQVLEARDRERMFAEYEIKLARFFGLSLLVTEIGTVETFNQDRLVSRVGARSRYQMMPAMLRARDIHHYRLRTRAGTEVSINEEWHPLLTMEAAFIVAKAYSNAVGHEIPGLSAYHTGPYNIFRVYREFLTAEGDNFSTLTNVVGGYLWGLTAGFDRVSQRSSFRTYSRSYVPSLYGALRATEELPVDTTATLLAERVRLRSGESMFLSQLLEKLDGADERLVWRVDESQPLYERFRAMNPHFDLPPVRSEGAIPEEGDVYLVGSTPEDNHPVRFFLPLGATAELRSRGVEELDYDDVFRFDHSTYEPIVEPPTVWDELYSALVADVHNFGFTFENRAELARVADHIDELARVSNSHYRRTQRDVVRLHERVWASREFDLLAKTVPAARGRQPLPVQPPSVLSARSEPTAETVVAVDSR